MAHTERIISEETIFTGKVFTVKTRQVELENGKVQGREVVLHNGGAAILPVDDEGNVYLSASIELHLKKKCWKCRQASWKKVKTHLKRQKES